MTRSARAQRSIWLTSAVAVSAIAMVAAFLATPLLMRFERAREDARQPIAS